MLSNKLYRKYGDIWGELFRFPRLIVKSRRTADIFGRRPKNNTSFYRFTFYVGRFGFARRRKTRYGRAFVDKQKLKLFYGAVREVYVRRYWSRSLSSRGNALFVFCHLLEARLESLLFRANFGFTSQQCKDIVEAGLVSVGARVITRPSYQVSRFSEIRLGIGVRFAKFYLRLLRCRFRFFPLPSHLLVNYGTFTILYLGVAAKPFYPVSIKLERLRYLYHA